MLIRFGTWPAINIYGFKGLYRTSIGWTASSGRTPISGRFSVHSDSFQRQDVQRSAGLSCKRDFYAYCFSPFAYRSLTVLNTSTTQEDSKKSCNYVLACVVLAA
jgi:hypothetical protein